IQKTKQKRQVIFTTHNANIVVNGDADKIVALVPVPEGTGGIQTTPRIAIDVDGAIETPGMREIITHTMEGGKEAFELRSRKYAFLK
ncbi:MAG: hypothetical protein ACREJ0_08445, partial [Geminicoccaceae bacterium]